MKPIYHYVLAFIITFILLLLVTALLKFKITLPVCLIMSIIGTLGAIISDYINLRKKQKEQK